MNKKCRTANIGFAKWRFSASYDSFVVAQTLVLRMNICGENRQLLVAANRYAPTIFGRHNVLIFTFCHCLPI
jgi:hypothetical protein